MAYDIVVADPTEAYAGLSLGSLLAYEDHLVGWPDYASDKLGEATLQADVDGSDQMPACEGLMVPSVDHDCTGRLCGYHVRESEGIGRIDHQEGSLAGILRDRMGEVAGLGRLSLADRCHEGIPVRQADGVVGGALLADRGPDDR